MKILIIDDSSAFLNALARLLQKVRENVVFAECTSAQTALTAVRDFEPDVVYLDHSLSEGGAEGFKVLRALRGTEIEIISTTSNADTREVYKRQGIVHVSKSDLANHIRARLTKKAQVA